MYTYIRLVVYMVSVGLSMYALSAFNYDGIIRKNKLREFYAFYFISSIALGYIFGSFILEFVLLSF